MARGSNLELQTQPVIAKQLGLGEQKRIDLAESLSFEIGKMLVVLMKRL